MLDQRTLLAAIVAPLAAPVLVSGPWLFSLLVDGPSFQSQLPGLKLALGIAAIFSYFGFFLIGVPTMWLLNRYHALNLVTVLVAGAVGGIVISIVFAYALAYALGSISSMKVSELWRFAIFGPVLGCSVALTFALLARLPRRWKLARGDA